MTALSVIVIAHNEEHNIAACLESVAWADDLVVVDAQSTDRTREMAANCGAKVFERAWDGYASAKRFALEQTAHPWVLWLDADERVTPELAAELQALIAGNPREAGYDVARRAYFLGRWIRHCGWYPGYVLRLFRKECVQFHDQRVHEYASVNGPVGRLRSDLLHYTDDTLYHYLKKFNRYTSLAAEDRDGGNRQVHRRDVVLRPPFAFLRMYILRGGFLDGRHGLVLSLLSSAYVFAKYAKWWELSRRP